METRKPPRGLSGAPWIEAQRIDLDRITEETLIFEGPATEACRAFPANVNVLAALSLAGIGPEKTRIKLYAVPGQRMNMHRITVPGEFGRLAIQVENVPPKNPPPGTPPYLSTIPLLRDLAAPRPAGRAPAGAPAHAACRASGPRSRSAPALSAPGRGHACVGPAGRNSPGPGAPSQSDSPR